MGQSPGCCWEALCCAYSTSRRARSWPCPRFPHRLRLREERGAESGGLDQAVVTVVSSVDDVATPGRRVFEKQEPVLDRVHLPHRSVEFDRCREPALLEDRATVLGELCRAWLEQ